MLTSGFPRDKMWQKLSHDLLRAWHNSFVHYYKTTIMDTFKKTTMTTLKECVDKLQADGYTENFLVSEMGIEAPTNGKTYIPNQVLIDNFYRFEGESDPADSAIVYAVTTNDGIKGILIDSYGATDNPDKARFVSEIEEMHKKKENTNVKKDG